MMQKVIIATKNPGKAKEFIRMFEPYGIEVKTLLDFPEMEDIEETGQTFEENAILKAEAVCEQFGQMVIADDSGLIVDALDGRPGIYSARYAGEEKNDEANNDKLLEELKDVKEQDRTARFYCASGVCLTRSEYDHSKWRYVKDLFYLKEEEQMVLVMTRSFLSQS